MRKIIIALTTVFLIGTVLYANSNYYYYKYKEKKPLEKHDTNLIICFQKNYPQELARETLKNFEFLETNTVKQFAPLLYQANRLNERSFTEVKENLLENHSIESVHPIFKTSEEGMELYLNGEICLQFFDWVTDEEVVEILGR